VQVNRLPLRTDWRFSALLPARAGDDRVAQHLAKCACSLEDCFCLRVAARNVGAQARKRAVVSEIAGAASKNAIIASGPGLSMALRTGYACAHVSQSVGPRQRLAAAVSRRSDLAGAKLHVTFANGKVEQVLLISPPLGSSYTPRAGGSAEADAANAYRAAVHEHQMHNSVTARVGLLLQNAGADTAEDVLISIKVPEELELTFVEQEPPPKAVRKTPVVPLEPSPRSWHLDSPTSAHCRVVRVTSSVGLPPLFLTLRDRKSAGNFALDLTVTAVRPAVEHTSQLHVQFVQP